MTSKCYKPRHHYFVTDALHYSLHVKISVILLSSYFLRCSEGPRYSNCMQESTFTVHVNLHSLKAFQDRANNQLNVSQKKLQPSFWLWLTGNNSCPDPNASMVSDSARRKLTINIGDVVPLFRSKVDPLEGLVLQTLVIMLSVWSLLKDPGLPWEPYHEDPYQPHHHSYLHQIQRQQSQCKQTKKNHQL